ncbi:MAG: FHA domain-containing protein, partial [Pseudomonadota bacterium]
ATNVRLGRHRDNDICIANHSVHRQHAVILQDSDGQFAIRDLGTKNGIVVNNVRCSQVKLNDGDVIELGEVRLRYVANT